MLIRFSSDKHMVPFYFTPNISLPVPCAAGPYPPGTLPHGSDPHRRLYMPGTKIRIPAHLAHTHLPVDRSHRSDIQKTASDSHSLSLSAAFAGISYLS